DTRSICGRGIGTRLAQPGRRNLHLVTCLEAMVCPNPAAVNTDLPAPQQPVETALRYTWQLLAQEIVHALPRPFGIDLDFPHSRARTRSGFWRLLLHRQ